MLCHFRALLYRNVVIRSESQAVFCCVKMRNRIRTHKSSLPCSIHSFSINLDKVNKTLKNDKIVSVSSYLKIVDLSKLYDRTKILEKGYIFKKK